MMATAGDMMCCARTRGLEKAAALVRKVSATISRRDFLRPYMDRIEAMIATSGAPAGMPGTAGMGLTAGMQAPAAASCT